MKQWRLIHEKHSLVMNCVKNRANLKVRKVSLGVFDNIFLNNIVKCKKEKRKLNICYKKKKKCEF